jgi:dihydroorotate dehydrogenase
VISLHTHVGPFAASSPVWVGSSEMTMDAAGIRACIDAGAGAVIAKSVNENPAARAQLAIADYVYIDEERRATDRRAGASLLNRSGLADVGLDAWIEMLADSQQYASGRGSAVIGSITLASVDGAAEIARRMAEVVPAVELNVGAPHGREAAGGAVRQVTAADAVADAVRAVRSATDGALFVKLPGTSADPVELAAAASDAGADAVTLMGRFNGFLPDLDTDEPLLGSWGAYGGPWALPMSLFAVSKSFRDARVTAPLIGTNGARNADDVVRFLLSGARAVELVDILWQRGPSELAHITEGVRAALARRGMSSPADLVGIAADRARAYADIPPRDDPPRPWSSR